MSRKDLKAFDWVIRIFGRVWGQAAGSAPVPIIGEGLQSIEHSDRDQRVAGSHASDSLSIRDTDVFIHLMLDDNARDDRWELFPHPRLPDSRAVDLEVHRAYGAWRLPLALSNSR